jgi:origin recognition complex subunit 4
VGKTLVLRRALATLAARHGDTLVPVRLSGLLHADERTALREVARQLGAPPAPEPADDEGDDGAGADGHAGGSRDAGDAVAAAAAASAALRRTSVSDNMALMAQHLRTLEGGSRAALFILEEFDLFAGARHKQMLLYNLMDALQACGVRAAVVGVSVRTDAAELLEKRVRSRFSHRRLVFEPEGAGELMRRLLTLPAAGAGGAGGAHTAANAAFAATWNASVASALCDARAVAALTEAAGWDRTPRGAASVAMLALAAVTPGRPLLAPEQLCAAVASLNRDPFAEALTGATACELHLLVACKRLQRLRERPSFNFAAVFEEYERAVALGTHPYPREVALRAFEALAALGVLEPAEGGAATGGGRAAGWLKEYAQYTLLLSDAEAEAALRAHPQAPTGLADLLRHEGVGATGALQA